MSLPLSYLEETEVCQRPLCKNSKLRNADVADALAGGKSIYFNQHLDLPVKINSLLQGPVQYSAFL